jgi:hypothetical protein
MREAKERDDNGGWTNGVVGKGMVKREALRYASLSILPLNVAEK